MAKHEEKADSVSLGVHELKLSDADADTGPRPQDTYYLLRTYALKSKKPRVAIDEFSQYVIKYSERYGSKYPQLSGYARNTKAIIISHAQTLAGGGNCSLEYEDDKPKWIFLTHYFIEAVRKAWEHLEKNPEDQFPSEESLGITIPTDQITAIDIKMDFVSALRNINPDTPVILRLIFPEDISSIIITSELLRKKLLEYAVHKMRIYLSSRNNAGYMLHKLIAVLKGNEHVLRELIDSILTKPGKAINTFYEPTDISFRFWAHLANLVIQEYKEKRDKLIEEHGYCQASYLLGFYNVYYKGITQKENERRAVIKNIDVQLRKSPYAFTIKDFYAIKDSKGIPLVRKETKDIFIKFLEEKTKTLENTNLPELVRLRTPQKQEYYIHRDFIIPLFVKKLFETARKIKEFYIEEWEELLRRDKRTLTMIDDMEFSRDLDEHLKADYPILYSLLNFDLLYLAAEESKISYDIARELNRCFDDKKTRLLPTEEIMGFTRKELLQEAKLHLPLWQRISILKYTIGFFKKLFLGFNLAAGKAKDAKVRQSKNMQHISKRMGVRDGTAASGVGAGGEDKSTAGTSSTEQRASYRKAIVKLRMHLVGTQTSLPEKLEELIEKWNPLYDSIARHNLTEDVNAMIRDFMRGLRRGFRVKPPDAQRIEDLAEKLSKNRAFERIKRRDYFKHYIEIYMVKLLGEK